MYHVPWSQGSPDGPEQPNAEQNTRLLFHLLLGLLGAMSVVFVVVLLAR